MSEQDEMKDCLTNIRAYAAVISLDNWRDILLRIRIEGDALEALLTLQKLKAPQLVSNNSTSEAGGHGTLTGSVQGGER